MATADQGTRTITYLRLDDIREAEINPKAHDLEAVRKSVKKFGFVTPGLRDDRTGRLIAGHGRTIVLRGMHAAGDPAPAGIRVDDDGMWLAPVITGWASHNDDEAAAYLVIDNHHPTLGGWQDDQLAELLAGIRDADATLLDIIGFTDDDLTALLDDEDDQPEPEPAPAAGPQMPVRRPQRDHVIDLTAVAADRVHTPHGQPDGLQLSHQAGALGETGRLFLLIAHRRTSAHSR